MFYFALGVVVGVFLPVTYNALVKGYVMSVWDWINPKQ